MKRSVFIIDDEIDQATNLCKVLNKKVDNTHFNHASSEDDFLTSIEEKYFSIAIVDLRMDALSFDGVELFAKDRKNN